MFGLAAIISSKSTAFDSDYQALLTYADNNNITKPSTSVQAIQNKMIVDFKANGLWDENRFMYVFSNGGKSDFARINWKNPSQFNLTGAHPTIAIDNYKGINLNGFDGYDTGYNFLTYDNFNNLNRNFLVLGESAGSGSIFGGGGNGGSTNTAPDKTGVTAFTHTYYNYGGIWNSYWPSTTVWDGILLCYTDEDMALSSTNTNRSKISMNGVVVSSHNNTSPSQDTSFMIGAYKDYLNDVTYKTSKDSYLGIFMYGGYTSDSWQAKYQIVEDYKTALNLL